MKDKNTLTFLKSLRWSNIRESFRSVLLQKMIRPPSGLEHNENVCEETRIQQIVLWWMVTMSMMLERNTQHTYNHNRLRVNIISYLHRES
jgi:hypothetical protein